MYCLYISIYVCIYTYIYINMCDAFASASPPHGHVPHTNKSCPTHECVNEEKKQEIVRNLSFLNWWISSVSHFQ